MALAQINKLRNFRASTGSTVACPAEREKPALVLYQMQPLRVSVPVFLHANTPRRRPPPPPLSLAEPPDWKPRILLFTLNSTPPSAHGLSQGIEGAHLSSVTLTTLHVTPRLPCSLTSWALTAQGCVFSPFYSQSTWCLSCSPWKVLVELVSSGWREPRKAELELGSLLMAVW